MTDPAADVRGIALLHDARRNRSTAFSHAERDELGLTGLLPEGVESEDRQLQRVLEQIDGKPNDLERYIFLTSLQDNDETLFYRTLMSDPARFMPLVYTPTVGEACQKFDRIFRRPRGLYLSINRQAELKRSCATGRSRTCASSWSPTASASSAWATSASAAWASRSASWRSTPPAPACRRS